MIRLIMFVIFSLLIVEGVFATPVSDYGQLKVSSGKLRTESGNIVQLRGMSLFWNNYDNVTFWKPVVIKRMAMDWNMNVIRLAMGAEDQDNKYYYDKDSDVEEVSTLVDAAIEAGIYVIIDWHGHYANNHLNDAKDFFATMAKKYGDCPNVIYEVWNEPITNDWGAIKSYAESVLSEIRKYDPDNIVIVGTGFYCQNPQKVVNNEVKYNGSIDPNVMYAIHVYAASHDNLYSPFNDAVNAGLPLFMSEWGTCSADGDGEFTKDKSDSWVNWMNDHNISWCNWSLFNKPEAASALKTSAKNDGNWTNEDLTASGKYIFNILKTSNPKYVDDRELNVVKAKSSGNNIYLWFNKPLSSISTSDFSVSDYNITDAKIKGEMDDEVLITLDKNISTEVSLSLNVTDAYDYSTIKGNTEVTPYVVNLPLKVNVAGTKSFKDDKLGYVAEQPYELGKVAWGTTWYDANGGSNKTASHDEFYDNNPQLDTIMGTYMYGFKSINVSVTNGKYVVLIFSLEDIALGPEGLKSGRHQYSVIAEGDTLVKNFDAYHLTGDNLYKVAVGSVMVEVNDGLLNVDLVGRSDYPMVSGIVIGDENYVWGKGVISKVNVLQSNVKKELNLNLYPNPFNPIVNVNYSLPKKESVSLKIYDVKGSVVFEKNISKNGSNSFSVNMSKYASGMYFFRMTSQNYVITKKAILLK